MKVRDRVTNTNNSDIETIVNKWQKGEKFPMALRRKRQNKSPKRYGGQWRGANLWHWTNQQLKRGPVGEMNPQSIFSCVLRKNTHSSTINAIAPKRIHFVL
ncbi:hypothetical protein TNCT_323441 [Trichonephila clavata]|uniref:Uncharacterized protein n=1 Tax=Trichonephila clavata TaxID=2740835 RepID=A0A8X6HN60_TRICU|nr:hypothetical protein TNCT_323441 [Trichonephila clavata]